MCKRYLLQKQQYWKSLFFQWTEAGHRGHSGPNAVRGAVKDNRNVPECATTQYRWTVVNRVQDLRCIKPSALRFVPVSHPICILLTLIFAVFFTLVFIYQSIYIRKLFNRCNKRVAAVRRHSWGWYVSEFQKFINRKVEQNRRLKLVPLLCALTYIQVIQTAVSILL